MTKTPQPPAKAKPLARTRAGTGTASKPRELPFMALPLGQRGNEEADAASDAAPYPVGAEIRYTHLLFKTALQQRFRAHNVTSAQWAFLRILWNEDGINQKDLASRLGVHATTTVPALAILERNGFVRRERHDRDKRNMLIYLTDAGKQLAFELVPYAAEMNERSLAGLSGKDAKKLMDLLWKVQENLRNALRSDGSLDDLPLAP